MRGDRRLKKSDHSKFSTIVDYQAHSVSIEANSPNPYPPRGIYGFILFLFGWALFITFLLWAFVPTYLLQKFYIEHQGFVIGLSLEKYWAVFAPALIPLLIACFVVFHCVWNAWHFRGIFENIEHVKNDFTDN